MRRIIPLLCLMFFASGTVNAQETDPFIESGISALFVVDDDTTTAMYSFSYVEPSQPEIRWLMPLPPGSSAPQLTTGWMTTVAEFQTEPIIEPPYNSFTSCQLSYQRSFGDGITPYPAYYAPDDSQLQVIESADAALIFLQEGGLSVTKTQRDAITSYVEQGYTFAGLAITPAAKVINPRAFYNSIDVHLSPTVVVSYPGTVPIFPTGLRAAAAAAHLDGYDEDGLLPVTAYILAETSYSPANVATFTPDLWQIDGADNELTNTMRLVDGNPIFFNQLDPEYYHLVQATVAEHNGQAFANEYRGQPVEIKWDAMSKPEYEAKTQFNQFATTGLTLSRLRTFVQPDQAFPDVRFSADPYAQLLSLDLPRTVDPAWFFGCTSRKLYDPNLEARLPEGRSWISNLHLSLAHPTDWALTVLDTDTSPVYVIAPQTVTDADLRAAERGHADFPMLIARDIEKNLFSYNDEWQAYANGLPPQPQSAEACSAAAFYQPSPYAMGHQDVMIEGPLHTIDLSVFAPEKDCTANRALYDDLLSYAESFQFFVSPELRHTLFIGDLDQLLAVPYPEGWIEGVAPEVRRLILPEGAEFADSPAIRTRSVDKYPTYDEEQLRTWYGLPQSLDLAPGSIYAFTAEGRRGFVIFKASWYADAIEFSAPVDQFEANAALLHQMAVSTWAMGSEVADQWYASHEER